MKRFDKFFLLVTTSVVLVVHVIAYRIWLFSSGVLTQGDWILSLPNWSKSLFSIPTIWKSYAIGAVDFTPPFYIFLLIEGFLSTIGISYAYIERIIFMWPIAVLTIPLSYIFLKYITKNSIAALVGALIYAYNSYFLIIQTGHLTLMIGFTFAPIVLLFFMKTLEQKSWFYSALTGITGFLISFYEFRAFYLLAILAALYYFYYICFIAEGKKLIILKRTLHFAFLPMIIVLLLNFYWILPLMHVTPVSDGSIFNRDLFGKEFMNINKATALFHPYWNGTKYLPFVTQPIQFQFFVLPILAFIGMFLARKNKIVLFYGLVALMGIFLTKQNNIPFPDLYYWMYTHIPGFNAFREASKFYFYIALSYSVLIAAFISWIWENWKTERLLFMRYVITSLLILICLINIKPLVLNEFDTLFKPRTMPAEYISFNNFIDNQNSYFRTLWLPVDSRWGTNTNLHPKVGVANIVTATWKKFTNATEYPTLGHQFIDIFTYKEMSQLLNLTSIKYIIVPIEDNLNDDNFFQLFFKQKKEYIAQLDNTPYLTKVNLPIKDIIVYENASYRPHIYLTQGKENLLKDNQFIKIKYETIDTTHYKLYLENVKDPFYLHFTDSYHPDWKIRIGSLNWVEVLNTKNYFLSDEYHFKNEAHLNTFLIEPDYIANKFKDGIKKNNDGTYDIMMNLYFAPQSYMNAGGFVSLTVFIVLLTFLIIVILRKYYARKNK